MRLLVVAIVLLAVSQQSDCLPGLSQRVLRRFKRQYVPPSIPYASIRAGRIPERLKNRLRAGSASTNEKTTSSSSSKPSKSNSEAGGSTSYGGQSSNPYGGQYNPVSNQGYGQTPYGQQNIQGGVPMGPSTYPYLGGLSTFGDYDNPYAAMRPPNPRTAGYQPQPASYQPMGGYSPYGGGYGRGYQMGGNPYFSQGGMYGGQPQMPYRNPYAMAQTGIYGYGTGLPTRGRSEVGASIGSPYRDPNARFTSYVHPNPQSGSSRGYQSGSSYGTYGGGSSQYGQDPYDPNSSQGGYSSYYSGSSYGGSSSSPGQTGGGSNYETGGAYGGYTSSSSYMSAAGQASEPAYGGQRSGAGRFVSGNNGGSYVTDSPRSYGDGGGSSYDGVATNNDQYGRGSMYSAMNPQPADNPYSQTSGSQYGGSSDSQYSYGGSRPTYGGGGGGEADSQYNPYGQSYSSSSISNSQSRDGQSLQTGRFHNPPIQDVPTNQNPSQSSRFSQSYQGGRPLSTSQHDPQEDTPRTSGRYYNPANARVQSESRVSESHQTGRFYNPPNPTANYQSVPVSNEQDTEGVPGARNPHSPTPDTQSDSPVIAVESRVRPFGQSASRENYVPQEGTFLIPRRKEEKPSRKQHPAMKKCAIAEDGLPDLYLNPKKMRKTVHLQLRSITELGCAKQENCFPKSVDDIGASVVRKLLRFATIAHNIGTAVFYPHRNHTQWKYHKCHRHVHSMKEFAHFHLLWPNGTIAAQGHKASFCLEDSGCTNPCKKRFTCTNETQGISPGCYDSYLASRDCQWIDVTDVETGIYTLRVTVNPLVNGYRAVPELSYTNNAVECSVSIEVGRAEAKKCWIK